MKFRLLFFLCLVLFPALAHAADEEILAELHEQVVQVPIRIEGLFGGKDSNLTATTFRPDGNGPFPLIVLSHGTSPNALERANIGRYRRIPQIREFVNRGFAVIVPIRRGFGATGGDYAEYIGKCASPIYYEACRSAGSDIVATVNYATNRPDIHPDCVILVGQSTGGFASLAAASMNPRGLIAVINFSGGHGGDPAAHPGVPCDPQSLRAALAKISETIKVPVLWHYAENDKYFSPSYAREWFSVFEKAGGKGRLVIQPPYGKDGHSLFTSTAAIPIWTKAFDTFLIDYNIGGGQCGIRINR